MNETSTDSLVDRSSCPTLRMLRIKISEGVPFRCPGINSPKCCSRGIELEGKKFIPREKCYKVKWVPEEDFEWYLIEVGKLIDRITIAENGSDIFQLVQASLSLGSYVRELELRFFDRPYPIECQNGRRRFWEGDSARISFATDKRVSVFKRLRLEGHSTAAAMKLAASELGVALITIRRALELANDKRHGG